MDSWLLKLLSEKHENKNKKQRSTNKQSKSKNIIESKNYGKYNTYHRPLSQKWIDGRYWSSILYALLTQVMSNLLPRFRVVLKSIRNNP